MSPFPLLILECLAMARELRGSENLVSLEKAVEVEDGEGGPDEWDFLRKIFDKIRFLPPSSFFDMPEYNIPVIAC